MVSMADQGCGTHWPHSGTCELGVVKSSGSALDGRTPFSWGYEGGGADGALLDRKGARDGRTAEDHTQLKPIFPASNKASP